MSQLLRHSLHSCLYIKLAWSFACSVTPSPVDVNEPFQISWVYREGDSPDGMYALEVQGDEGYFQLLGFYSATTGNITAKGLPSTGFAATSLVSNTF